ncbi:MAG: hypothetical protein KBF62_01190 [Candidatus Pacebacteria bacterium]|nr:hypothetical protein [Candidatus Paceibacterota bacterium]MBP9058234.1 hypothetical protein [Candidatus Paceibacterota bacterium]MBP9770200.1 hypothetical protein [Candidatus Paceibacterota bacterium]
MIKNIIFVLLVIIFVFYVNIVPIQGGGKITIKQSVKEYGLIETFDVIFSAIGQKITGLTN